MSTAALPQDRKAHLDTLAITLLVVCCAFWGFQQILIKVAGREIAPMWQAALRMWGATALLWLWCRGRRVPLFERDGSLPAGLLVGALFAAEFVCLYVGLQYTAASRLTVFLYTSPFWVALLVPRFVPSERLRVRQWLGLCLAFAAVVLAFAEALTQPVAAQQWWGDALGLAAGLFWGLTTVAIRSTRIAQVSAEKSLFYQLGVTAAVTPVLSLLWGEPWGWSYSAMAWGSVFLQTAVGAFATYLAWMWMLRHYPATRVATFTFLTPLFALVFGVALLDEPLTLQLLLALGGVTAGIVLVSRR
ncbi:DMT family transporter [Tepidimonas charontis]|uniref:Carboxylate/amino acid/amine transporter n=1 Tax=Tepidimonas charontis TaxID=2267262 RepID=A0A554XHH9_9BURK|nr:DMT family transporter [Tepidimonas charontis]TSE35282.1 carboxylate/amino acid/amine transporter [Tepidimonas charontis]